MKRDIDWDVLARDAKADPALHAKVAESWAYRAKQEHLAVGAFALITHELASVGCEPVVMSLVTRAANDEVRHAEICARMAACLTNQPFVPMRYRGTPNVEDKVVAGLAGVLERDRPLVVCEIANAALGEKVAGILRGAGHGHIYEIHNASRFGGGGGMSRALKVLREGVNYTLTPLTKFEDRIYPMIVASHVPLLG